MYSEELAEEICAHIADGGSLREWVFGGKDRPKFSAIHRWLNEHEGFKEAYALARETQAHNDADKLNELQALMQAGVLAPDVARVSADILKWTAARRAPKAYGDKVTVGSDTNAPLIITWANGDKV